MIKKIISIAVVLFVVAMLATSCWAYVQLGTRQNKTDWAGTSVETKPTTGVTYGSTYYETDTGTLYVYTGQGWVEDRRPSPPKS